MPYPWEEQEASPAPAYPWQEGQPADPAPRYPWQDRTSPDSPEQPGTVPLYQLPGRDFGTTAGGVELLQAGAVPAEAYDIPPEPETGLGRAWDAAKLVFGRGAQDIASGLASLAGKAYQYTPFALAERLGTRAKYGAEADTGRAGTGVALEEIGERGMAAAEEARIGHMAQYGADPLSIAAAATSYFPDEVVAKAVPAAGLALAAGRALPKAMRATKVANTVDAARAVTDPVPPAPSLAVADLEPVGPAAREAARAPESFTQTMPELAPTRTPDLSPPGVVTDLERMEVEAPAQAAVVAEEVVKPASKAAGVKPPSAGAFGRARKFWDRWMASTRGLGDETFRAIESREAMIAAAKLAAKDDASALHRMMDQHIAANPGIDDAAFRDQVRARLVGDATDADLPENIQKMTAMMRNDVDSMTMTMIDEGMVGEELADVFRENLGSYMTRSYRAFDDPRWIEKLRQSGEWNDLKAEMRTLDEFADMPDAELEGVMEALASNDQAYLQSKGGLGTVGTGIYQHRANVPEPIRKLLGEYTDPAAMHYRTVERMVRNIESHRMYSALADIGRREGWVSDVPLSGVAHRVQGGVTRNPLGEVFVPEEMKLLIEGAGEQASTKWLTRTAMKAAGLAKEAKTVQSIQAQFRNLESNQLLLLGSGNLGGPLAAFAPWRRGQKGLGQRAATKAFMGKGGKKVARAVEELDLQDINTLKSGHIKRLYDEAAEHGLVGQQIDLADMKHFLAESDDRFLEPEVRGLRKAARATRQSLRTAYEAGDVIPKLSAWKSEQAKYRWAHPDWNEAQVEAHAAEHVKNVMPTYSRVPRSIEAIRQQPFVGNFISFASEIPRNVKNNLKIGLSDIREGKRTGNKRLMYVGAHRLASQGAALGGTQIAKASIRDMSPDAPSEDVSSAVAPLLPPWLENGQYFVSKIDGDDMVVWDLSFMDPYAQIKDAYIAGVRGGEVDPAAWDRAEAAARSFAEVYMAEGVLSGAAIDAYRGRTSRGKEIWREQDPTWAKFVQGGLHLGRSVAPGTLTSLERIAKGSEGSRDIRGRTYELGSEVAALFGPRPYTVNIPGSLEYAAGRFSATKSEASWREGLTDDKSLTMQERVDPARLMSPTLANEYRRSSADQLVRTLAAAEAAGFGRGRIIRTLDKGGMSKADAHRVISGIDAAKSGGETWDAWLDRFTLISAREAAERRRKRSLRSRR